MNGRAAQLPIEDLRRRADANSQALANIEAKIERLKFAQTVRRTALTNLRREIAAQEARLLAPDQHGRDR